MPGGAAPEGCPFRDESFDPNLECLDPASTSLDDAGPRFTICHTRSLAPEEEAYAILVDSPKKSWQGSYVFEYLPHACIPNPALGAGLCPEGRRRPHGRLPQPVAGHEDDELLVTALQ